ncbi:hypothetical protein TSUD_60060 [Trifolium subterraneum]|uniref:Uncharacterized protein n=1 Tax=Trifolium subterraneum TaxID=3900 RepID=A0A2Z6P5D3_TRISU|nr:hypothetical protein TSUD_60060 [Trifolium subterraneum]
MKKLITLHVIFHKCNLLNVDICKVMRMEVEGKQGIFLVLVCKPFVTLHQSMDGFEFIIIIIILSTVIFLDSRIQNMTIRY